MPLAASLTSARTPGIQSMTVRAFQVPTETPEADGTLNWNQTTLVLVELGAGDIQGIGYTYADAATARFIEEHFRTPLLKKNPVDIPTPYDAFVKTLRNEGRPGVASMALSAIDIALWDLKAKLFNVPLARLFGRCREAVPLYGSGGFTSYSIEQLQNQLRDWAASGMRFVKMKVGTHPDQDIQRVRAAREVIGDAHLFVDGNGAYQRKQALELAEEFRRIGVRWFEEPVSSDDLEGLRLLRDRGPVGMAIAAGEYGYELDYFRRMLQAGAVDVMQIDVTRCGGYTGFLKAAALAEAFHIPISAHCAPTLHVPLGLAIPSLEHIEYFFDHVRIEQLLFDGAVHAECGMGRANTLRPGLGLTLRESEAEKYAIDF